MRADGLAVLSEQGVAKSLSLSDLYLHSKPGVCVCVRACSVQRCSGVAGSECGPVAR